MPPKKRPVSPDESTSGGDTTKRKKNISRACTTCRRRRMRCDGNARCSTCVLYEEDCVYEPDLDGRKPATKMFVEALQNRIRVLEDMLGDRDGGDSVDSDNVHDTRRPPIRPDRPPASQKVSGSLIVDNESLAHHGPTSVFMHLPEPSSSEETGLTPTDQTFASYTDLSQLDWARHLPPSVDITYEQHELLLDHFFSYFNGWSWWIDERPFRADWAYSVSTPDPQTRTQHYSPLLHNAILSVVSLFIDAPEARRQSQACAVRAASLMEGEAERGMCSTVRGLLFLGSHHWAHNKRSTAWLYEGAGVRLAQTMGLNVDCSHLVDRKLLTAETKRQRDRCFYTVYLQDQLWSLTYGRAAGLTTQDFETTLPPIDPEADQVPWLDHRQRAASRRGEKVQAGPSWMSTTFHYSCVLAGIADRLQKGLYRMRSRHQEAAQRRLISALHLELNSWLLDLPSPLRLETAREPLPTHVINMHAMCRYLQILLHRPTYTRPFGATSEARDLAIKTCDFAASDIMRLLRRHEAYPGMRYTTTATVNITFTVGTIHLLTAVQPSTAAERRTEALNDARDCIRYLKAMPWLCATKGGEALEKMLIDWNILPREPSPAIDLGQFGTTKDLGKLDSEISKFLLAAGWKPPEDPPAAPKPKVVDFGLDSNWSGGVGTNVGWDLMSTLGPASASQPFASLGGHMGSMPVPALGQPGGEYMNGAQGLAANPFQAMPATGVEPDLASFFPLDWAPYIPSLVDILGSDTQS